MGRRRTDTENEQSTRNSPAQYTRDELDRWMVAQVVRATLGGKLGAKPNSDDESSRAVPDHTLSCERCGTPRRLVTTLPAAGDLPPVDVYECVGCKIINLMQNDPG
jgi:hypothetical protein